MRCLSIALFSAFAFSVPAWAKLPAVSDEAKAKAAEGARSEERRVGKECA